MGNIFGYSSVPAETNEPPRATQDTESDIIDVISKGPFLGKYFFLGGRQFVNLNTDGPPLFGDSLDYNFFVLNSSQFDKPLVSTNSSIRPVSVKVNLHKETLRAVNDPNGILIEFQFDSLQPCKVQTFFFAKETFTQGFLDYHSTQSSGNSAFHSTVATFPAGFHQHFKQKMCPALVLENAAQWDYADSFKVEQIYPIVIVLETVEASGGAAAGHRDSNTQQQATICTLDIGLDQRCSIRCLKQKVCLDGVCIYLQDVYGLENKAPEPSHNRRALSQSVSDNLNASRECVVCLTTRRDTIILPCRHLCLCRSCALTLRHAAFVCPICRSPFRAMLRLRGLKMIQNNKSMAPAPTTNPGVTAVSTMQMHEGDPLKDENNAPLDIMDKASEPGEAVVLVMMSNSVSKSRQEPSVRALFTSQRNLSQTRMLDGDDSNRRLLPEQRWKWRSMPIAVSPDGVDEEDPPLELVPEGFEEVDIADQLICSVSRTHFSEESLDSLPLAN